MHLYRRLMAKLAAKRGGTAVLRRLLPSLDRAMLKLTGGRRTFTGHALPTLVLTTTGRKSGEPRVQPLCYVTEGQDLIVVGSNWGQEHHPAWTSNLLAQPRASVTVSGRHLSVEASLVPREEQEALYRRFEEMSENYASYPRWAGQRQIRMFRLKRLDPP